MKKQQHSIDELWDIWRTAPLRAPASLRETFELLAHYDPALGLDALLERVDFDGLPLSFTYERVLNRAPEGVDTLRTASQTPPRRRFKGALLSDEFQSKLVQSMLAAFPEKRRCVFLHIPKCAGTNLAEYLIPRYLPLARAIESKEWTPKPKMLEWLAGLVRVAAHFDEFFVYGHTFFGDYLRRVGTRGTDRIFTVVRDPLDIMISQANYNVGLLRKDPGASRPDTRQAMRALGLQAIPDPLTDDQLRAFARQALRNTHIAQPNRICTYLGDGRADAALANLIIRDVEVTDMQRYAAWMRERFGIECGARRNESLSILRREDVAAELETLAPLIAEDQKVFDCVTQALGRSGQVSVRGLQLADFVN